MTGAWPPSRRAAHARRTPRRSWIASNAHWQYQRHSDLTCCQSTLLTRPGGLAESKGAWSGISTFSLISFGSASQSPTNCLQIDAGRHGGRASSQTRRRASARLADACDSPSPSPPLPLGTQSAGERSGVFTPSPGVRGPHGPQAIYALASRAEGKVDCTCPIGRAGIDITSMAFCGGIDRCALGSGKGATLLQLPRGRRSHPAA